MNWYYYLHIDGNLIGKNPAVVDSEYFNSDFVKKVWHINTEERSDAWTLILESLAAGAKRDRVSELIKKWNCDIDDAYKMIFQLNPTPTLKKGLDIYLEMHGLNFDQFEENGYKIYEKS